MKMTCDDVTSFIDLYLDHEFGDQERAEMDAHLAHCEDCRQRVEQQLRFKQALKSSLSQERAPDAFKHQLMARLQAQADQHQAQHPPTPAPIPTPAKTHSARVRRYGLMAAPIAAVLGVALALPSSFTIASASSNQLPIVKQSVDWHRGNYPMEIQSQDARQVANWFSDKVAFPVRLPHFAQPDARLIGGRLAHVQDRHAALVTYEVEGSRLSVMMFQGDGLKVPSDKIRKVGDRDVALMNADGYEIAIMQNHGVTYAVTGELTEGRFTQVMEASLRR